MKPHFPPSCDHSYVKMADWIQTMGLFIKKQTGWLNDKKNYWTWLSQNIVICQCLADQLFASVDLLTTDKSWYFAQPRPITVNCII